MTNSLGFLLLLLIFTLSKEDFSSSADSLKSKKLNRSVGNVVDDSLFVIIKNVQENSVQIVPPKSSNFILPDSAITIHPFKYGDFNADGKEDILVSLGACGTGGCVYGLFINHDENHYSLAFMDYLKNVEFEITENGFWTIFSSEEIEAYNPSKLFVSIYKFDKKTYIYVLDSTYIHYDKETETMINEMKKLDKK